MKKALILLVVLVLLAGLLFGLILRRSERRP